ncbi:MAG: thioesterase family protein [Opitutaceae bacterium]|jgi:acyl-CoA thioester hydrolase
MIQIREEVRVRYAETDQMGFAYHGDYAPWFESARTSLLRAHGLPYRDLETQGFYLPVLELHVNYKKPARYDDVIVIVAVLREKPTLRVKIEYEVLRGEELLATGHTLHAFIDKTGRPVRPPATFAKRMTELFSEA